MYATIRSYTGTELTEALAGAQSDIREIIAAIPGFRSYYLLRDEDGSCTTISIFDDEAGADASVAAAADYIGKNLAHLSPAPPVVVRGEVIFTF